MALLKAENVTKKFGEFTAVRNVTLSIEEGGIWSIIGPNGAGKTTFFNLLTGYLTPTEGRIYLRGEDITHLRPHQVVKKGLSRSFQIARYFEDFTVFENIAMGVLNRRGYGLTFVTAADRFPDVNEETRELVERLGLQDVQGVKARYLSYGDKKILDIAMSLTMQPSILLLDEPTAGVSGAERSRVIQLIEDLAKQMKIVIVEHDMDIVFGISERIIVLHQGSILAQGTAEEIRANPEVQKAYLGED